MTAVCVRTPVACCSILSFPVEHLADAAIYDAGSAARKTYTQMDPFHSGERL